VKILFTYEYPFHKAGYGGGQQIVRGFSKALSDLGNEVNIACLGDDELGLNNEVSNVQYNFQYKYKVGLSSTFFATLGAIKLIRKLKPDFVLSFSSEALFVSLYCKLVRIPFYIYVAAPNLPKFHFSNPLEYVKNIRYHLPLYFQYLGGIFSTKIFTISEFISLEVFNHWKINQSKILTAGCAISEEVIDFKSNQVRKNTNGIKIATTGRIMYTQKPINILAKSLSNGNFNIKEWHIVGSGSDLEDFKGLIEQLNLINIAKIHSTLSTKEICNLYGKMDIIILPSMSESFFITAYEAISLKKILITNKVALLNEIFKNHKTVIFADDTSEEAYRKAISKAVELLKNPEIDQYLFQASEFVNDNYNWEKISTKFLGNI
jgi:glycosyltransferase involved in cell wall biosynthesis